MKKSLYILLTVCFTLTSLNAQAKKALIKKSSAKKSAETVKKVEKEEPVWVYNEDFEKGEELFGLNKPAEAITYFEKCLDVQNINPSIWIHLGVAYYQTGDFTRSYACCTKGLTKPDTDHKILAYNAGNSAYALTNYARAEASYAIAIKEDENFGPAYLNRANAQLKQDHLQDAKTNYTKYLEIEPDSVQRPEIERLIMLLDEEIIRRAKEKPELIDLDFSNVKNDEMIVETDDREKVDYQLPEEKIVLEDSSEELVVFEIAKAPAIPGMPEPVESVKEEIPEYKKVEEDVIPQEKIVEKEEITSEVVSEEVASAPAMNQDKVEAFVIPESAKVEVAEGVEIIGEEELPDALLSLPAGTVSVYAKTYGFSPNSPNPSSKRQVFDVSASETDKVVSYNLEILDEFGNTVKNIKGKKLPKQLTWDGRLDSGALGDGRYTSRLTVKYKSGGSVSTEGNGFNCFSSVPQVTLSSENENFSPDGDNVDDTMKFKVNVDSSASVEGWKFEVKKNNKTIYSKEGNGVPGDFEWDGKTSTGAVVAKGDNLSYKMTVTDTFGVSAQDNGKVEVTKSKPDPVVAKKVEVSENSDGTVNIAIPTLSFKINSWELVNTKQNSETIQKVYDILIDEKYEDYSVTITGYVNPDGELWTNEEEQLALKRAKSVEDKLRELGVSGARMESKYGEGKTKNKEYNRRVEFKLKK